MNKRAVGVFLLMFSSLFASILQLPSGSANPGQAWMTPMAFTDWCGTPISQDTMLTLDGSTATALYHAANEAHELIWDLGCSRDITKFRWYVGSDAFNRDDITSCDFYITDDLDTWGTAVATGVSFTSSDSWNDAAVIGTGRFIKMTNIDTADSGYGPNYLCCWEVQVMAEETREDYLEWRTPSNVSDSCGETAPYPATNYVDGNLSTGQYWFHQVNEAHWIVVDLGGLYEVRAFAHWLISATTDYQQLDVNVYVSDEATPASWGDPVNILEDLDIYDSHWNNWTLAQGTVGRYVNLTFPDPKDGSNYLRAYECSFLTVPYTSVTPYSSIILNGLTVDSDVYVFAEEQYYIYNCTYVSSETWSNITETAIRFTDGQTWIEASYNVTGDEFTLVQSEDVAGHAVVRFLGGDVYNASDYALCVHYEFYFTSWILDSLHGAVELWGNDTSGLDSGWVTVAGGSFIIYNYGGQADLTSAGQAGRVAGGDVFDLYLGSQYWVADLLDDTFDVGAGSETPNVYDVGLLNPAWQRQISFYGINNVSLQGVMVAGDLVGHPQYSDLDTPENCLWLHKGDTGVGDLMGVRRFFVNSSTQVGVQFYVMLAQTDGSFEVYLTHDDTTGLILRWDDDAHFYYQNSTADWIDLGGYLNTLWYNVTLHCNLTDYTFDMEVDGVGVVTGGDMTDHAVADFNLLSFWVNPPVVNAVDDYYVDEVKVWNDWQGGAGAQVRSNIVFRNLQHIRLLVNIDNVFEYSTSGLLWSQKTFYYPDLGDWLVGMDYVLDDTWIQGWYAKVTPSVVHWDAENAWLEYTINWYYQGVQIKSDTTVSLIQKRSDTGAFQYAVYIDLWFNKVNASSVIGGRINSEYWGMSQHAPWWSAWWKSDWRVETSTIAQSMLFTDLLDESGTNLTSARQVQLMRVWMALNSTTSNNPGGILLHDFDVFNYQFAQGQMIGVDTPLVEKTKFPDMPSSGFVDSIIAGFKATIAALLTNLKNLATITVQAIDWLFTQVGWTNGFSQLLAWIEPFITWMVSSITYGVTLLTSFFTLLATWLPLTLSQFSSNVTGFVTIFTTLVTIWTGFGETATGAGGFLMGLLQFSPLVLFIWIFASKDLKECLEKIQLLWGGITSLADILLKIGGFGLDLIMKAVNMFKGWL